MLKRTILGVFASMLLVSAFGSISACNTMHGVGQDIERGGEKIQHEANEHR